MENIVSNQKFSLFEGAINNSRVNPKTVTLSDVFALMHSEKMRKLTEQLRAIEDPVEQKKFKANNLCYITPAGTFSYRNEAGLISYSGLACFDFDGLKDIDHVRKVKRLLMADPYFETELLFTSPRGKGCKWITHIDLTRADYKTWYRSIMNYVRQQYGLVADSAPSNVASACFLCFDAEAYVNSLICKF